MVDDPAKPAWAAKFFVGVPAPAGAITVLLPIYIYFLGVPRLPGTALLTFLYTLYTFAIAVLMVSRLPVFSGKRVGKRIAPEMVLPVFVMVVLFFALLISYPWVVLTTGTLCYLVSLPVGYLSYRRHERNDAAGASAAASSAPAGAHARTQSEAPALSPGHGEHPPDRPARLN
jgi:CDP-diacylglycerol--serine O-phosphatidyltransferase